MPTATGSGKTTAVLAPCLKWLLASDSTAAVLYVVPTRALARDLRRRPESVLPERLGQHRLWQTCAAVLQSDWQQRCWDNAALEHSLARDCVAFQEQQRSWRERDILALQRLPLPERVERYRALGSLTFQDTTSVASRVRCLLAACCLPLAGYR